MIAEELASFGHDLTYFPIVGSAVQAILGIFIILKFPSKLNLKFFFHATLEIKY